MLHLAQTHTLGLNFDKHPIEHGLGFSRSDIKDCESLDYIISLWHKYIPKADIVVEVTEPDYRNSPSQFETYNLAKDIISNYHNK